MSKIIHKANYSKTFEYYIGFGQHGRACTPLCDSKPYKKNGGYKTYTNHRLWSKVTCQKCLKLKESREVK